MGGIGAAIKVGVAEMHKYPPNLNHLFEVDVCKHET